MRDRPALLVAASSLKGYRRLPERSRALRPINFPISPLTGEPSEPDSTRSPVNQASFVAPFTGEPREFCGSVHP